MQQKKPYFIGFLQKIQLKIQSLFNMKNADILLIRNCFKTNNIKKDIL